MSSCGQALRDRVDPCLVVLTVHHTPEYSAEYYRYERVTQMMGRLRITMALCWMLAACGGGEEEGTNEDGNTGDDEEEEAETLQCAADKCKLPKELEDEELCCIDNFAGGCGIKIGSTCREMPEVDTRCPAPKIMVNFPGAMQMRVFGCCTSNDQCGVDFGMGCQPRTIACMAVSPDQVDQIMPQTCDGEPLELPANCGMGGFRPPIPQP